MCIIVKLRVEAKAVLVEHSDELIRHRSGCAYCLEGSEVQWDFKLLTVGDRGIPYNNKGVVLDQWWLSWWHWIDGIDRSDNTEGEAGQEVHHDGSGQN